MDFDRWRTAPNLPLLAHSVIRTNDRDVALEAAETAIAPMDVDFRSSHGHFEYHLCSADLGRSQLLSHEQFFYGGSRIEVEPSDDQYVIEVPIRGICRVHHGEELDLVAGRGGVITSPTNRTVWEDDGMTYQAISLHIDAKLLSRRFNVLTGTERETEIEFDPHIDLNSSKARSFISLFANAIFLVDEDDSILTNEHSAVLYEELLINSLLTGFEHSGLASLERTNYLTSSGKVRMAEDYMEENAHRAITISEVAEAIGTSVRSLQRTFEREKGVSPMRRLKTIRLERARALLHNFGPEANITQIAMSCGFAHLGAFSYEYKRRYGETASQTIQRVSGH